MLSSLEKMHFSLTFVLCLSIAILVTGKKKKEESQEEDSDDFVEMTHKVSMAAFHTTKNSKIPIILLILASLKFVICMKC